MKEMRTMATIVRYIRKKSPVILTGFGISGMILSTALAVKATPEAMRRLDARKRKEHRDRLTVMEVVQTAGPCYIFAAATGTVSAVCLVGASAVNEKRNAALAAVASLAETGLREYRGKVVETIGEKKEAAILDAIDQDRVEKNPPSTSTCEAPIADHPVGQTLCYDSLLGGYFYTDVEMLRRAECKLNRQMATMTEPYISLNEFLMEIGRPPVDIGDYLGWNVSSGLIELRFSSQLLNGRTPCLVMSHLSPPMRDYDAV